MYRNTLQVVRLGGKLDHFESTCSTWIAQLFILQPPPYSEKPMETDRNQFQTKHKPLYLHKSEAVTLDCQ